MKLLGGISGLYSFFSYSINDMLDICLVAAWQFSSGHRLWNTIASRSQERGSVAFDYFLFIIF